MTEEYCNETLEELERLLNDPDVPMQPALIWRLLDKVSKRDLSGDSTLSRILAASPQPPTAGLS